MAGTLTLTSHVEPNPTVGKLVVDGVADAATGSFPTLVLPAIDGHLVALVTNPGATAPTDNYDITLVDVEGADRLQGVGANRDTVTTEQVGIVYTGTSLHPPVAIGEALTLTVAGNIVNSALIHIVIYYGRGV
jgi:hypothetical protein